MSETSRFWSSNGTGDGATDGHAQAEIMDFLRRIFCPTAAEHGVLKGVDNDLAVSGTATPLAIASGAAVAYGFFYENTAALSKSVSTPSAGTTGGRVSLSVDWTAQTVRVIVETNTDGVAAPPALTQVANTRWDIPLATFTITTGGVIAVTDARVYARMSVEIPDATLRDSAALSVIGRAANSAGAVADIAAAADGALMRSGTSLAFAQVNTAQIANNLITLVKLAADSVDITKLGERVPGVLARQGGDGDSWLTPGSTTYTPGAVRIQVGSGSIGFNGYPAYTVTRNFPTAFSYAPLVFITGGDSDAYDISLQSLTNIGFSFLIRAYTATPYRTVPYHWIAIGPE